MDKKKPNMVYVVVILAITWISTSEAYKFDFPKHTIGVNYSAMDELKPYLKYNPVDLGIDNLDDYAPTHMRNALVNATLSKDFTLNQYAPNTGLPIFLEAVAKFYSRLIGQELIPEENVLATIGATGAVFAAIYGHTTPGDEWILIQPAYTMYLPMIKLAHGVARFTNLKLRKTSGKISGEDWVIDKEHMESLFNNKTKGILINNPLNPLGKVYTLEELELIAGLAKKYDTLVVSDEAHEWLTQKPHIRIASLPGMFERTIGIGSSSKSFSASGWRVGWAYGPAVILNHLKTTHERTGNSAPTPQQAALAFGFDEELRNWGSDDSFFATHRREVREKRDYVVRLFEDVGMKPSIPDGGNCMFVNWTTLKDRPFKRIDGASMSFVKWFIKNVGVLGLPGSSYYADGHKHLGEDYVRYCFHKSDKTLKTVEKKLQKLKRFRLYKLA